MTEDETGWMDLETIILNEVSQKKRQISYDIAYICTIKYDANELTYKTENRLTDREQTD